MQLLDKVKIFRNISKKHRIGSSIDGDNGFLEALKACTTIEKRDNLMIPSSPVHRKLENNEEISSHVFNNSDTLNLRTRTTSGELNFSEKDFLLTTSKGIRGQKEKKQTNEIYLSVNNIDDLCQTTEYQLGFSPLQLKNTLPIPPSSIFLQDNEHSSILKLLSKKDNSLHVRNSSIGDEEYISQASNVTEKNSKRNSLKKNSTEILEPDCIGLLVRSYFEERIDVKDKRFISKFIFSSIPQSIKNHQLKAFTLFSDCKYSSFNCSIIMNLTDF